MRYWLLHSNDEYYIQHGNVATAVTALFLTRLTVIKSVKSKDEKLAYKILIAAALAHYNRMHP